MSTIALESALSGLRIAQQQLSVISTNIANVQTPGYTRKILPQSVRTVADQAVGVQGDAIIRRVDLSLSRDLWTQISTVGALDTQIEYLNKIQDFHGDPSKENTIAAKIAALKDSFSSLSDDPTNSFLLNSTLGDAKEVAKKFNDFSDLLTQLRNDADDELGTTVDQVNTLLTQIADLNKQMQAAKGQNRSTATIEDLRDNAVKDLAGLIDVSFFTRGDGVMVVQTKSGVQLADEGATNLYFKKSNIGPEKYYPDSVNGIFIGGDPSTNVNAYDVIPYGLGGKVGALVELRDTTLTRYQAQLDETAYRLAQRFDDEGLTLFTDENNTVPVENTPIPNPPGPLTAVSYTGFAASIQVNTNIQNDPSLLQKGTDGDLIQSGSNEVIRRIVDFTFGTTSYESVTGSRDIRVSVNPAGDTLQENLGLYSSNTITSSKDTSVYVGDMNVAPGNPFNPTGSPPYNDNFTLRFYDARVGADSGVVTIDLTAAAAAYPMGSAGVGAGIGTVDNAAEQVASYINAQVWPADLNVTASVNTYGQLTINSRGNVDIGSGDMGDTGLAFLGLSKSTVTTTDPYFDIQVGNDPAIRITIAPGDTQTDLVNKIDAVPGIDTTDIVIDANGYLSFRPQRGGDIKVIGGPFTSSAGFSTAGGNPIIKELFGTADPVVVHAHSAFRSTNLGPGVNQTTQIITGTSIIDYGQKMINAQTQDQAAVVNGRDDQDSYRATLEKKLLDESAVNIDEELANMVVIQSAYAAAARAITTVNDMFKDLIDSVR